MGTAVSPLVGGRGGTPASPAAEPDEVWTPDAPVHRLRDLGRGGRWAAAVLGVALLLAPLISFARFVPEWTPAGDPAVMALRARDVGTSRNPLIGQSSTAGQYIADDDDGEGEGDYQVNHLGPAHYYLLAPAVRALGAAQGMLVVSVLVVGSSLLVAAWAVFRQLGVRAGVIAVLALGAITFTTGAAALVNPLNSVIAGYPLLASMVLAWCVLCRDVRVLPLTVAFVSFTAQQHLSVVPIVLLGLGVGVVGAAIQLVARGDWRGRLERRRLAGWSGAAVVVGLVAWAPPLIQQFTTSPGNLELAWRFAREGERVHLGYDIAARQVLRALGLPPILFRTNLGGEDMVEPVPALTLLSALTVLVLVAGLAWRWRTDHPRRSALGVMVATLVAAGLLTGSSLPPGFGVSRMDFYHWMWPLLLFVVVLLGLAVAELAPLVRVRRRVRPQVLLVAAVLVVAVPAAVNPALDRETNATQEASSPIDSADLDRLADQVVAHRGELGWPVVVLSRGQFLFDGFDSALAVRLEERNVPVHVSRVLEPNVHPDRLGRQATAGSGLLVLVEGPQPRQEPRGGQLIAEVDTESGFDFEAYEALVEEFEEAGEIRLSSEVEDNMADLPGDARLLLTNAEDLPVEEAAQILHDPQWLDLLLEHPLAVPDLDAELLRRVRDSLPEYPRVFRVRVYLLDRAELLAQAGPSELVPADD